MIRLKDLATAIFSTVLNQLSFLTYFLITAYKYGPEGLGQVNFLMSIGMVIGAIIGFRYDLAGIADSSDRSFLALFHSSLVAAVATAILLVFSIFFAPQYSLVPIFGAAFFMHTTIQFYLTSRRLILLSNISRTTSNLIATIIIIFSNAGTYDYSFFAYSASSISVATISYFLIFRTHLHNLRIDTDFYNRERRFAIYSLPSTIMGLVFTFALPIYIPVYFNRTVAGHFSAAYRLTLFPITMLAQSISTLVRRDAFNHVGKTKDRLSLFRFGWKLFLLLIFLSSLYACFVVMSVLLVNNISALSEWTGSSPFALALLPLFSGQLLFMPISQLLIVAKRQRLDFFLQATQAIALGFTLLLAHMSSFGVLDTVIAFSLVGGAHMVLSCILVIFSIRSNSAN